ADGDVSGWARQASADHGDMALAVTPAADSVVQIVAGTAEEASLHDGLAQSPPGRYRIAIAPALASATQVPPPEAHLPRESVPVPDRWRIMQALDFRFPFYDPYNQNVLKGDLPIAPDAAPGWFFSLGLIADTTYEMRRLPIPIAPQTSTQPGTTDIFGSGDQSTFVENFIVNLGLTKGNTTFKPPDYEFRFVPVFNFNRSEVEEQRALFIDARRGTTRTEGFTGIQELFADVHLRNVSDRYDFDSLRVGIQPMQADFRGFLFQDNALGVRLFGTRDNNHWQYNLGWMRRLEKDTNSGLNDLGQRPRDDDVFFFNVYRQDFPRVGFTSQFALLHNRNGEAGPDYYDDNGFLVRPAVLGDVRPHDYQVTYLGYNGDGHFNRWNLTASAYAALGKDERHPLPQREQSIRAFFAAGELSRDFDWIRLRSHALYASGDKNPFDGTASGFDAILENPQFAGADTSFFMRQSVPLIGGGGVALSGRNGLLPSLRSSKDKGQSNFINPGLTLLGAGADFDVLPTLRLLGNLSWLRFNETAVLGVLRNQQAPDNDLGIDVSAGLQFRPLYSQNIVITGSFAALIPGKGLRELYADEKSVPLYSALLNVILAY
ncbi:MAG: hypothetical protein Q8J78_03895, partial [Moraxellaceae bacterium]|nr:hypothetical protein [Moraxellaceae bacterium]